ncbi:hypothetical protein B296_00015077 [Ensete ventricosum]|uniref:Uncharacterized protein n=1 Tax=Ensete ventricosum TaxID=4639 RepID=A0A426Z3U0_ENSVE|nr:hypothetical protein B296_00015077 [Ensete ventricosum]
MGNRFLCHRPWAWLVPAGATPTARPQGAVARCKVARGSPPAKATACKGGRWQERSLVGAVPAQGGVAHP